MSIRGLATDFILPLNHLGHNGQREDLQMRALSALETQAQNKQCGRRHESTLVSTRLFPVQYKPFPALPVRVRLRLRLRLSWNKLTPPSPDSCSRSEAAKETPHQDQPVSDRAGRQSRVLLGRKEHRLPGVSGY